MAQIAGHVEGVLASHLNQQKHAINWPRVGFTWECEAGGPGDLAQRARICATHVMAGVAAAKDEYTFHMAFDKGYSGICFVRSVLFCCFVVCCFLFVVLFFVVLFFVVWCIISMQMAVSIYVYDCAYCLNLCLCVCSY